MTMSAKNEYLRAQLPHYLKANKDTKTKLLDDICQVTGYHRKWAVTKLWQMQRRSRAELEDKPRRSRGRTYGNDCLPVLKQIWEFLEYPCGKRLAPYLPKIIPKLEAAGVLACSPDVREKLHAISAATVDRLLQDARRIRRRKCQTTTKPGTLLKHQIPVRHEPWPETTEPGYQELDFVAHCGESAAGDFLLSLTVTDIATTWVEHGAQLGRSQRATQANLDAIQRRLPFVLKGLDPDNDSAFINWNLKWWCDARGIDYTRSRPYRKNDNAHVEQKNWSTVRQVLGYQRLDTNRQLQLVTQLYAGPLRDWQNFFQPTLKLTKKERRGARVVKAYDTAATPYQRVLDNPHVSAAQKHRLQRYYETLNPVTVKRQMEQLIQQIFR